ncbi:putative reverse transcriptase domain-containing protein [Tanacetum coccineum]
MPPRRRFILTAPPPRCDVAESSAAAARALRDQYDFVDTVEVGHGLIHSLGHDAQTIARAADRAEDIGYVRALQASEHRMMTSIKEVNLRVSYQAQVHRKESEDFYTQLLDARTYHRDIRLEIDVKLTDKYCPNGEIKKLEIELWNLKVRGNDVAAYTQCFQELALMCTKFLTDETAKIDKYIGGLLDNIHGNVMSARPKTLDFAIELANDLMDQKLRTYAER